MQQLKLVWLNEFRCVSIKKVESNWCDSIWEYISETRRLLRALSSKDNYFYPFFHQKHVQNFNVNEQQNEDITLTSRLVGCAGIGAFVRVLYAKQIKATTYSMANNDCCVHETNE